MKFKTLQLTFPKNHFVKLIGLSDNKSVVIKTLLKHAPACLVAQLTSQVTDSLLKWATIYTQMICEIY